MGNNRRALVFIALLAATPVWLAASLRPDAFYVGDSGVKLIAARAALANPAHPFDIPLPEIAGTPAPHVEPFFRVHGEHTHAVTSPLFPVVSAPLLAAFGPRGLYLIPYLSLLAAAAACARLSRARDLGDGTIAAAAAILGTPFLFYSLEFWEHMPAVAAAAIGAVLFVRAAPVGAGIMLAIAILLRPEAACFAAGLVLAGPFLGVHGWQQGLRAAAGALLVLAPYELYLFRHFGSLVPEHISANAVAAAERGWFAGRVEVATAWFATTGRDSVWFTAPAAAVAVVAAAVWPRRYAGLAILAAVTVVLTVATVPNAGGGQWGPRYLLLANIPLAVIAADALERLPSRRTAGVLFAASLVACFWLQRTAYRELRNTKAIYGATIDFIGTGTVGRPIVTDVWWLDQAAASVFGRTPALYAPDAQTGRAIVGRFSSATVPAIAVVRPAGGGDGDAAWLDSSCYFEESRAASPDGALTLFQLRHRCRQ